jgi:hypothetical protein
MGLSSFEFTSQQIDEKNQITFDSRLELLQGRFCPDRIMPCYGEKHSEASVRENLTTTPVLSTYEDFQIQVDPAENLTRLQIDKALDMNISGEAVPNSSNFESNESSSCKK